MAEELKISDDVSRDDIAEIYNPDAPIYKASDLTMVPGTDARVLIDNSGTAPALQSLPQSGEGNDKKSEPTDEDQAVMGYDKQIDALNKAAAELAPETEEQRKKRERQERSRKIIAAVGDGISALSNLFFTSQYAPNAYNPRQSQLGMLNDRFETLKAERKANGDKYTNFMVKIGDLQNAKATTLREMKAQQEAQRLARERAAREEEAHKWKEALQPDIQREQKGKADKAGYDADTAKAKADYAPKMQQAELETEQARKGSYDASAAASRASATNSYASAEAHKRKDQYEFYGRGRDGKERQFKTRQAAIDYERRQETYDPSRWGDDMETVTVVEEDSKTGAKTTTQRKQQIKQSPTNGGNGEKQSPTK